MNRSGTIREFLSSPLGDQVRLSVAALLLTVVSIAFTVGSFSGTRRYLLRLCDTASGVILGDPTPKRIVSAVEVADRLVPGHRTCLMRSLTAEGLLRLYAFRPDHRIGVAKETDAEMKAHSWLELGDEVLIGDLEDLSQYDPLPSLEMGDRI
jgi:hypothetical protein